MAAFTRSYVLEEYRKLYHRRARKRGHKAVVERIEKRLSPGCSPADDNACSMTPVEMTLRKWFGLDGKSSNCATTQKTRLQLAHWFATFGDRICRYGLWR